MPEPASQPDEAAGVASRRIAVEILDAVIRRHRPLDEQLEGKVAHSGLAGLSERDRALVRNLVATVLRRLGTLRYLLGKLLARPLPDSASRVETVLMVGAAQILWFDVPDHAAVDVAVRLIQANRHTARFAGLANAVLRRIAREGRPAIEAADRFVLDIPDWLRERWVAHYGDETARAIAEASLREAALDLSVKDDAAGWAERLGGTLLPTGTVRLLAHGAVPTLPGYDAGAWWVQDAAAALPARLLGTVRGLRVADLCAAPGGKTAQLAAAGAMVTAVDRSPTRIARLRENLARLGLSAETVIADAATWEARPFDAVLLDAPCLATGTIRRHPDILRIKQPADLAGLIALQRRLLANAATLLKPGGTLVYCTCSLEPEEGEHAIADLLAAIGLERRPIDASELAGQSQFITAAGDLRTLPYHWGDPNPRLAGLDGFFASRLVRP